MAPRTDSAEDYVRKAAEILGLQQPEPEIRVLDANQKIEVRFLVAVH